MVGPGRAELAAAMGAAPVVVSLIRSPDRPQMLWVPRTSSTSCDQAVFVDHAADARVSSDSVLLKVDRFGGSGFSGAAGSSDR
jgi:hypothetical protein